MPAITRLLLAIAGLFASIAPVTASPNPGTVGFNFERRRVNAEDAPHVIKRQSKTVHASLTNELILYFINVTVGTPGQPFSLQLDTGSSDIWFPSVNADICVQNMQFCPVGTYDSSASSTFAKLNLPEFQIQYVDGSQIAGEYISDVLNIGDTKLTNMTMAEALTASKSPKVQSWSGAASHTFRNIYPHSWKRWSPIHASFQVELLTMFA
jgi:hypothetical protein